MLSCLMPQVENNQFINLTTEMRVSGCEMTNSSEGGESEDIKYIRCRGMRNFNTARDRWWFVAVSNCNSTRGLKMK